VPYVNIKVTKEDGGLSKEKKAELIDGVTSLLETSLGKNRASTVVIIDEIDTDSYGLGGEQITEVRKRGK
jgi:4-oxalocrotonate tautomerase